MPESSKPSQALWQALCDQLSQQGVDLERLACDESTAVPLKVVCVDASMRDSLEAIGLAPRDQVVMVRVASETLQKLDAWVESGAVRSRSEAAALFIREGLKVRAAELDELRGAIRRVDAAREKLRRKARQVLGVGPEIEGSEVEKGGSG